MDYIDSTFLNPSAKELEKILSDESNCEKDSLVELIFFPDESIQIFFEDFLESEDFQKEDEVTVIKYLILQNIKAILYFPDNRGALKLAVPRSVVDPFISRLNISRKLDKRLTETVDTVLGKKFKDRTKVKLRNSRFVHTENRICFLCRFFKKMDTQASDFFECLDFILEFLDELQDDADIFCALMSKKRFYFQSLQKVAKFEEQLKKSNMETLILQGVRSPYISKDEARNNMRIIDRTSLAVFGKTDYFEHACDTIDLGEFHQDKDMEKVVRILL